MSELSLQEIRESVRLRDVRDEDLELFFRHMQDRGAVFMAAFTHEDPSDRNDFDSHWAKMRANPTVLNRTILVGDEVAGTIGSFNLEGEREVSYWLGREFWGRGVATRALELFLEEETTRPLQGHVAHDNVGSIRVMEKCGFIKTGEGPWFAHARKEKILEFVMTLK